MDISVLCLLSPFVTLAVHCVLVKCELRVTRVTSYELRVLSCSCFASCELVVKSASWYL